MSRERAPKQLQFNFGKDYIPNPQELLSYTKFMRMAINGAGVLAGTSLLTIKDSNTFGENTNSIILTIGIALLGLIGRENIKAFKDSKKYKALLNLK